MISRFLNWIGKNRRNKSGILVLTIFVAIPALFFGELSFFQAWDEHILDYRFRYTPMDIEPDSSIIMVSIDNESLEFFRENGISWPWPRSFYGHITQYLSQVGANSIVYDVLFYEPDIDRCETDALSTDSQFALAMYESGRVILGTELADNSVPYPEFISTFNQTFIEPHQSHKINRSITYPIEEFLHANIGLGVTNIYSDNDGVLRRIQLSSQLDNINLPSLGLLAWFNRINRDSEKARDVLSIIPLDNDGNLLLNWYGLGGRNVTFPYISFYDVIMAASAVATGKDNPLPEYLFKDKTIIIGAEASGLNDLKTTPVVGDNLYPGFEIWATLISNLLQGDHIYEASHLFLLCINLLFVLSLLLAFTYLSPIKAYPLIILEIILFGLLTSYLWSNFGYWVAVSPALFSVALAYLSIFYLEQKDRSFITSAFGAYIAPELITRMVKSQQHPELGGEANICTPYFTDIQSFSTFSELVSSKELVTLLNEYLTVMTDILIEEKGTLDKYEGDAIIAFFGAPIRFDDHADRAVTTAIRMQEGLNILRLKWGNDEKVWPEQVLNMQMRIGISTGDIVTGNMGSKGRMNYTMMGDAVNTAARLESSAKQYGVLIHISHHTAAAISPDIFTLRELGTTRVMGKSEALTTYEVIGFKKDTSDEIESFLALWNNGLSAVKKQDWNTAISIFEQTNELETRFFGQYLTASEVYLKERIPAWEVKELTPEWDCVWELRTK